MPTTRSSSSNAATPVKTPAVKLKRKDNEPATSLSPPTPKRPRKTKSTPNAAPSPASVAVHGTGEIPAPDPNATEDIPVPAELSFSFNAAKAHLIAADLRFSDLFARRTCSPYEKLETFHPFRALASSIISQQISTKAARSIRHKFIRLYDQSIPEKAEDYPELGFFPTAYQVARTNPLTLKTAGLSGRKAEYVQDLASRFSDGRLSTEKLLNANDHELAEMLIAVKGIGRWTVDMFAIFSLRRPDILPVGDLGTQRGMLRWFLSRYSDEHIYDVPGDREETMLDSDDEEDDVLPTVGSTSNAVKTDGASILPGDAGLPTTFTPSIKKTLNKMTNVESFVPPALPAGLTVPILKARLNPKSKIKGAILTPVEMEQLAESWRPYRSLAVYYMWALADV